jgi:hypothetical protein
VVYLGPNPSREDLRALTFSFVNVMTQLTCREPISPNVLTRDASTAYLFGLRNATETIASFMAQRLCPLLAGSDFVGMADHIVDSIHDFLESGSETFFDSNSSEGSHHPSRECFMVEISDGHVSSASDSGDTLREVPVRAVAGGARVPPPAAAASALHSWDDRCWSNCLHDSMSSRKQATS